MQCLITWGSPNDDIERLARIIGAELEAAGMRVALRAASEIRGVDAFDVVIIGGAPSGTRWDRDARRFVTRNLSGLREIPTWFFSSGSLDDPLVPEVEVLMARAGSLGHVTFGANAEAVRTWARAIAAALATARPLAPIEPAGWSPVRLGVYGIVAAAICIGLGRWPVAAILAAPVVFAALANRYFHIRGARDPLTTAFAFAAILVVADLVVHRPIDLGSTWLEIPVGFAAVWIVGYFQQVTIQSRGSTLAARRESP